jgi:hypothetical protein
MNSQGTIQISIVQNLSNHVKNIKMSSFASNIWEDYKVQMHQASI